MLDKLLQLIDAQYPLQTIDVKDMGHIKAGGMGFTVRAWHAQGLGHVSAMHASGFLGLMKMDTLVINPSAMDLPLLSYDRIQAMGNETLLVELYNTLAGPCDLSALQQAKSAYADLPDYTPDAHWYDALLLPESIHKKGKKAQRSRYDSLTEAFVQAYLNSGAACTPEAVAIKREKASAYAEELLRSGGPSTDVFKKTLGESTTARFFRDYFFGTANM